jgi:hypothetical protein
MRVLGGAAQQGLHCVTRHKILTLSTAHHVHVAPTEISQFNYFFLLKRQNF